MSKNLWHLRITRGNRDGCLHVVAMFRREKPDRAQRAARGGEVDGKQLENPAGEGKSSNTSGQQEEEEEEEEEEYPDNVECEDEYDEEDVYVLVELPASIDAETFSSAAAVTIKVKRALLILFCARSSRY